MGSFGQSEDSRESFKMSQERVKSKNLFNFRPQGFIDPVVVAEDEKMKQDFGLDPVVMAEHMKNQSETEFVEEMRGFMGGFLGKHPSKRTLWWWRRTLRATILSWPCQPSMTESTTSKCSCTSLSHSLARRTGQRLCTPTEVVASGALPISTSTSSPTWPSTAGWSSTTLTTGSRQRPGAPTMCSTFTRRSSMWQQTRSNLESTLQGLPWRGRAVAATSAQGRWCSWP